MTNQALTAYLNGAVEKLVARVLRGTLQNPRETAFLLRLKNDSAKAALTRAQHEKEGRHIPAFLISSITHSCNLFCKGCYARANGICAEDAAAEPLKAEEWRAIFEQAAALGIRFHLLAGGEPLLRRDVLSEAARRPETVFPVFTKEP